jgi:hypothetical protein
MKKIRSADNRNEIKRSTLGHHRGVNQCHRGLASHSDRAL